MYIYIYIYIHPDWFGTEVHWASTNATSIAHQSTWTEGSSRPLPPVSQPSHPKRQKLKPDRKAGGCTLWATPP